MNVTTPQSQMSLSPKLFSLTLFIANIQIWKGNPGSFSVRLFVFYILLSQLLTLFMYSNQCFEPTFVKVKCLPFWKPLLSVCWFVTRPSSSPPPFSLSPLAACCKSYRHRNKRQIHTGQVGEHGQGSVRVAAATPADWHTRDKALSGETTAGKDLDPLINKSHTDSLFQAADRSQFVKRSSESDSVAFEKREKITMGSHRRIRCAFPDKRRRRRRKKGRER